MPLDCQRIEIRRLSPSLSSTDIMDFVEAVTDIVNDLVITTDSVAPGRYSNRNGNGFYHTRDGIGFYIIVTSPEDYVFPS